MTEHYAANLLGTFATAVATAIEREVSQVSELGMNGATALVTVRNHPDDSIETLSHVLKLTHSGAVRLVNRLESEGLVARIRSDKDARAVSMRLTTSGYQQAEAILAARSHVTQTTLGLLDDEQRALLVPVLEGALAALTESKTGARRICRLCDEHACRPNGCPVEMAAESPVAAG